MSHKFSLMSHLQHFQPLTQGEENELKYGSGVSEGRRETGLCGPPASPISPSSLLWTSSRLVLLQVSFLALFPTFSPTRSLLAPSLGIVPGGGGARPHQGGIRAGLSSCLRLKACFDTCRTSPSQACTSCFREAESAESRASTALVTCGKQRVRDSAQPHSPL